MHKMPHEGPIVHSMAELEDLVGTKSREPMPRCRCTFVPMVELPAPATTTDVAAGLRRLSRMMTLRTENWTWPERPVDESPTEPGAGPEPVRVAFRHFLAGGRPYYRPTNHG